MTVAENIKPVASLVPAVRTANANGSAVDTMGFDNVEVVVSAGDIDLTDADETYAVKVQEGAQSTLSDAADISGASVTITADNQLKTIRIVGLGTGSRKRYMRAVLTVGGTTPSIPLAAIFNLGRAHSNPVNTPDAGA
jgi:antitoxin (DNA-binding transcriptional repressor) of toxin-antitoxin stability system